MRIARLFLIGGLLVGGLVPGVVWGQTASPPPVVVPEDTSSPPVEQFYRGEVVEITDERQQEAGFAAGQLFVQTVIVRFLEGPQAQETTTIEYGSVVPEQRLAVGQRVVLLTPNDTTYIFDRYRLPALGGFLLLFAGLGVFFAGWRGLASLAGLGVSLVVLALFVVPQIMAGRSPLLVSLAGAFCIAVISIYLAHGFNRRTTVAVVSTVLTVVVAIGLAQLFVWWAGLTGSGSEEAYQLQTSPVAFINLKGLLLGGIIIGALGVLDDITTSQAAAVYQIWRANPKLSRRELFRRGAAVGKEHITSLVNTLALAYVGASLPALLLFTVYQRPWWVVANTETIAEEVIRTLVGSVALMMAVPITTWLATRWLPRNEAEATVASPPSGHQH